MSRSSLTQEVIIERIRQRFGDRFGLEKLIFVSTKCKITLICPVHGEFEKLPLSFINSEAGCPKCAHIARNKAHEIGFDVFLERAMLAHPNAGYIYFQDSFVNMTTKTPILCPHTGHGIYWQDPGQHVLGHGCPACGKESMAKAINLGTERFIEMAIAAHPNVKHDYSLVNYVHCETPVLIGCPRGHWFFQVPRTHLSGYGCPTCGDANQAKKMSMGYDNFVMAANKVHGEGRYIYRDVIYVNSYTPVLIICPHEGHPPFLQEPHSHLKGAGCPECAKILRGDNRKKLWQDRFREKANLKHGEGRYIYTEVDYIHSGTPVLIICTVPGHPPFWQTPHNHLQGCGCPVCSESTGEKAVAKILTDAGIRYEREKTFPTLVSEKSLWLDFWLPDLNVAIEYHGSQHVFPVNWFGGEKTLAGILIRDQAKRDWAKSTGVKLIEISHTVEDVSGFLLSALSTP